MNTTEIENFYKKVHDLIPGGAHTYSKGDDQFPDNAPKIIDRGEGCKLWDIEGREYLDMAMSLGTTILGHAYPLVIEAAKVELYRGVNFCRPSVLEGQLAEMLVDIIPSAEMVKFGKNGSDAVTAAIKLARAYTGRDYVARCSADAFNAIHDWFIGSTVMTRGVPEAVQKLTLKFDYNNLDSCKKLFSEYSGKIACFILEPLSFTEPKDNFLQELKNLCEQNGTILIFDEVVSGFRFSLGGAQEKAGVTPHLSAFGKGMGNGFSVSALVGQREFMKIGGIHHDSERVFLLSTTHGGETHALAAAMATIDEIKRTNAIEHFWWVGDYLISGMNKIITELNCSHFVEVFGFGCKPAIVMKSRDNYPCFKTRTIFLRKMLDKNILIPYLVPSLAHKKEHLDYVLEAFRYSLTEMKHIIAENEIDFLTEKDCVKPVFRKFN